MIGLMDGKRTAYGRSRGLCERCGECEAYEFHHRQPRGMGGSRDPFQHSAANLLHCCLACHRWAEGNSRLAYEFGLKVRHGLLDPVDVPVLRRGVWVMLGHDGSVVVN